MSETDPSPLPTSKMELGVTIIKGSLIYTKSPSLPYWPGDPRICDLLPTLLLFCKISIISNNSLQPLISVCF